MVMLLIESSNLIDLMLQGMFGNSAVFFFSILFFYFRILRSPAAFITFLTLLLINHCKVNENCIQAYPK